MRKGDYYLIIPFVKDGDSATSTLIKNRIRKSGLNPRLYTTRQSEDYIKHYIRVCIKKGLLKEINGRLYHP